MSVIISKDDTGDAARNHFEQTLAALFADAGRAVTVTPHLYHVAESDEVWGALAEVDGPVVLTSWLHPRPAEWLAKRHGVGRGGLFAIDMRAFANPRLCADACLEHSPRGAEGSVRELTAATRERWYPIIDRGRCINCAQCMEFCLFGVYALDEKKTVRVAHPDKCKPGCPACARLCPHGAIMFPLHEGDEAIAGAPGRFVVPDDAAKAMFEKRTKRRHRAADDDDLDALIDDLDRLTGGRQ